MERHRFIYFDSLRALAALGVLGIHVGVVSGANARALYGSFTSHLDVGVTLFFLISSFLLYRPHAVALLEDAAPPRLGPYALHRLLRIAPAYWVALTLLALWPGLLGVFTRDWWIFYGFGQSYLPLGAGLGIGPAWSLSVEVAFYALLPLLAAGIAALCRSRPPSERARIALTALALLGAAGVAFRVWVHHSRLHNLTLTLPCHLLWFAAGMALAVVSVSLTSRERSSGLARLVVDHPSACWLLGALIYSFVCLSPSFSRTLTAQDTTAADATQHVLYCLVALLVMLPAVFGEKAGGLPHRILGSRALTALGAISYGFFLWHVPLLFAMSDYGVDRWLPNSRFLSLGIAILPVAIACGWLSYRLIEQPMMRLGRGRR